VIILWGFRRRLARLGVVFALCSACHTPAAQPVIRVRRWFTLFFIPIIPLGTKYHTTCTMCGKSFRITGEAATQLLASNGQPQPQPNGQPAPFEAPNQLVAPNATQVLAPTPPENFDDIVITFPDSPPTP
jgi:hypothetical protein